MNPKDNILFDGTLPPAPDTLHSEVRLFPPQPESCEISVACTRADYSASRIGHAVEDADAHLLNLNVTSETLPSGQLVVDLRVSHRDAGAVSRSLERYGYIPVQVRQGHDQLKDSMADRVASLMAQMQV
ncbi:MAG: hypothetical protein NC338_00620 [Firmicutes bacterium]|nr:hypothetical protein [Bacillota bacterium]MCM1400623.1 hypothetical protein [Bacteroides sp.]MCM1477875.1 hypothetical protein [Bacteroides sp.]